ncbi:50S ribosomal protein L6 [bacterium]|nr:50S ribosomal protein L6 [bacterium]
MSRVGLNPIKIEEGVQVTLEGKDVLIKGPKGELKITLPWKLDLDIKEGVVAVKRTEEDLKTKASHGTFRMLIDNAIEGVKNGFNRNLELVGVGYRARMEGTALVMNLGLNHPVKFEAPEGITIEVPEETKIFIKGIDKQKVGEFAAKVREFKKPEPYKGKGIRYEGEYVRRKSSKSGVTSKK